MHHGQLKMGGGVVDGDAGVLGDGHDDKGHESQRKGDADFKRLADEELRHLGQARRAGRQRGRQHHEQCRGLGERCDHHFAGGAEPAEACADVHRRQRKEAARAAPISATSATTSAAQLNISPDAKVGTSAAATQVNAKM